MLAVTLALTLLAQNPETDRGWALAGGGGGEASTVEVEGSLELSRGDAEEAALRAARHRHRDRLRESGKQLAERVAPFWLPGFLLRGEVDEWLRRQERSTPLRIVDRDTEVRSYSYGDAYRTTLQVATLDPSVCPDAEVSMERRLRDVGRLALAKLGGIAVFWGLLAFVYSWMDRLTRGYMPWRLRLIALVFGLVVPTAVVFV